ncbi:MAG: ATP-binding protein [Caldilineaceae bacterium]
MQFVAREMELNLLNNLYVRRGAQFLILYGRRRIGKTSLLTHWLAQSDRPHLYWMATQTSTTNQLRNFSQALFGFLNPGAAIDPTFSYASWVAAFIEVARVANDPTAPRLVIVLDEFTYVMQANPEVPSLLQQAWDHHLKESNLLLILSGSLAGIIQRTALDYQSPLYGRATARLRLQGLSFGALAELLPRYRTDQRVAVYAITGGVPAYIELFDDQLNIIENLRQRIVTPANVMLTDAVFLLHEQLDDPRNYMAIIEAIANGAHTLAEIAKMTGLDTSNLTKYIGVLRDLGYLERQAPATLHHPERSKQGRYTITDPYLRFYFRFLAPNLSLIERGMVRQTVSLLSDHLADFIGTHTFEELCRTWVAMAADWGQFPFLPERVGSFWSREAQVDVVAINWRTKQLLLGECKWLREDVGRNVARTLLEKRDKVVPKEGEWQVYYALFARHGFTEAAQSAAASAAMQLVTLTQMENDMITWLKSPPQ